MKDVTEFAAFFNALIEREEALLQIAKSMKDYYCSEIKTPAEAEPVAAEAPVEEVPAVADEPKTYSKEEVRAMLSQKAKADGTKYKAEVKALVAKYSSDGTLTSVPVESYADLMAELEGVGNG